ncbi:MAG TPA: hypothetical protein VFE05_07295, partial [Longimicrobiaceae bacterium]|nr:hypothetical protein [Longimicrobiaceae bacterium]
RQRLPDPAPTTGAEPARVPAGTPGYPTPIPARQPAPTTGSEPATVPPGTPGYPTAPIPAPTTPVPTTPIPPPAR